MLSSPSNKKGCLKGWLTSKDVTTPLHTTSSNSAHISNASEKLLWKNKVFLVGSDHFPEGWKSGIWGGAATSVVESIYTFETRDQKLQTAVGHFAVFDICERIIEEWKY